MSNNLKGIICIILSMGFFVIADASAKLILENVSWQKVLILRSGIATLCCFLLALFIEGRCNIKKLCSYFLHIPCSIRIICELLATTLFLMALLHTSLAEAISINQITPIIIMIGGIVFFKEKITWLKFIIFGISVIGVLIIIDPDGVNFNIGSLYALLASCFMAARDLATKSLKPEISSIYVASLTAFAVFLLSFFWLELDGWQNINLNQLIIITVSGVSTTLAFWLVILGSRIAEVSVTATYRYSVLVWGFLFSYLFFDEVLDMMSLVGLFLIVFAGLIMIYNDKN